MMTVQTYELMDQLRKKRTAVLHRPHGNRTIDCETAAAYRSKVHQLCSGTVLFSEEGGQKFSSEIIDFSKAVYIRDNYPWQKVAVFYQFKAERTMLEACLENITSDPKVFANSTDFVYVSQIQAGSQGVDLSNADVLIFLNLNFSAMHYWQSRARLQTMTRTKKAEVHYLFAKDGIERKILATVRRKEDYTLSHFLRDFS